jgi:hypothetical protein
MVLSYLPGVQVDFLSGFCKGHESGEHIPFRVPQHFGSQWHAFTQVVIQD